MSDNNKMSQEEAEKLIASADRTSKSFALAFLVIFTSVSIWIFPDNSIDTAVSQLTVGSIFRIAASIFTFVAGLYFSFLLWI